MNTTAIRGTTAELAKVITVNGQKVDDLRLNALINVLSVGENPLIREVTTVKSGQRGRPVKVWELSSGALTFAVSDDFTSPALIATEARAKAEADLEAAKAAAAKAREALENLSPATA